MKNFLGDLSSTDKVFTDDVFNTITTGEKLNYSLMRYNVPEERTKEMHGFVRFLVRNKEFGELSVENSKPNANTGLVLLVS